MNYMKPVLLVSFVVSSLLAPAQAAWIRGQSFQTITYSLYVPAHTAGDNQRFPMVTFLAGVGENGCNDCVWDDPDPAFYSSASWQSAHPCYVFAPVCPGNDFWTCNGAVWPNQNILGSKSPSNALRDVLAFVNQVCDTGAADINRLYMMGGSQGGYGTFESIERYPTMFAAAVEIAGGGDPSYVSQLTGIPLWAIHGTTDGIVPLARSEEMVNAIMGAGGTLTKHSWISGTGHLWEDAEGLAQGNGDGSVSAWLFAQSKGTTATARHVSAPITNRPLGRVAFYSLNGRQLGVFAGKSAAELAMWCASASGVAVMVPQNRPSGALGARLLTP